MSNDERRGTEHDADGTGRREAAGEASPSPAGSAAPPGAGVEPKRRASRRPPRVIAVGGVQEARAYVPPTAIRSGRPGVQETSRVLLTEPVASVPPAPVAVREIDAVSMPRMPPPPPPPAEEPGAPELPLPDQPSLLDVLPRGRLALSAVAVTVTLLSWLVCTQLLRPTLPVRPYAAPGIASIVQRASMRLLAAALQAVPSAPSASPAPARAPQPTSRRRSGSTRAPRVPRAAPALMNAPAPAPTYAPAPAPVPPSSPPRRDLPNYD